MSSLRRPCPGEDKALNWIDRLLGHWLWTAVMILVAAALTIPQLDTYTFGTDSSESYLYMFSLTEKPYSSAQVLANIYTDGPDQMPLYFLLGHWWGAVAGQSVLAARVLTVFASLLTLAAVYSLARDFVSPVAGVIAAFVLLSPAFNAYYAVYLRPYAQLTLLAALLLWLYLRMATRQQQPDRRDYLALAATIYALVSTHAYGFLIGLVVAMYHLLAVKKDRRWLMIGSAAICALLLAAPQLFVMFTSGIARASDHYANSAGTLAAYQTWINVFTNGSPILLAISVAGAGLGWRRGNPFLLLFPLLMVNIGVISEASGVADPSRMRYFLVATPILAVFIAMGIYCLHRLRRWLALLTLLWLGAGLSFMQTADWDLLLEGRTNAYTQPPWHLISRWMRHTDESLFTVAIDIPNRLLRKFAKGYPDLRHYYFIQYGFRMAETKLQKLRDLIAARALSEPGYWLVYRTAAQDSSRLAQIDAIMRDFGYQLCAATAFPNATMLATYRWDLLGCEPPEPLADYQNELLRYEFYAYGLDAEQLTFVDLWRGRGDHDLSNVHISYQLIDQDWNNVAQLDLPLVHEGKPRRFTLNLADVPAGDYRLMAVVYDAQTGERQAWQGNEGWIPEMQQLAEVAIPERAASSS